MLKYIIFVKMNILSEYVEIVLINYKMIDILYVENILNKN